MSAAELRMVAAAYFFATWALAAALVVTFLAALVLLVRARRSWNRSESFDCFLSYRGDSDGLLVEKLHGILSREPHSLRVWLDKKCLHWGERWEDAFVDGLRASTVIVPVSCHSALSSTPPHPSQMRRCPPALTLRATLLLHQRIFRVPPFLHPCTHPHTLQVLSRDGLAPFAALRADSRCDNVLLEQALALAMEERALGVAAIAPLLVGQCSAPSPDDPPGDRNDAAAPPRARSLSLPPRRDEGSLSSSGSVSGPHLL